jgi:hypothetical protein
LLRSTIRGRLGEVGQIHYVPLKLQKAVWYRLRKFPVLPTGQFGNLKTPIDSFHFRPGEAVCYRRTLPKKPFDIGNLQEALPM